jgi:hypothetical protein
VALAFTTSETERILTQLLSIDMLHGTGGDFKPKLIMTDMTFAAFNAWRKHFPGCQVVVRLSRVYLPRNRFIHMNLKKGAGMFQSFFGSSAYSIRQQTNWQC